MKVFVTGGSGFLGRHVIKKAMSEGHDVFTYPKGEVDLREPMKLSEGLRPDVIIHLAANVGGIGKNQRLPGTLAMDNLKMGVSVIDYCVQKKCKLVLASTICSYPKFAKVPFKEEDLWSGYPEETNASYGIAKKALMVAADACSREFGFDLVTLLPVNLYGPRDNFDLQDSHVIPAMMRKMYQSKQQNEKVVVLWGDGTPTREFLFVEDCAEAFVAAIDKKCQGPVNVGTGQEIDMKSLADLIAEVVGFEGNIVWDSSKPNGQPRRCLDVTKAKQFLGWEARTPLFEGIRSTYEWYLENARRT